MSRHVLLMLSAQQPPHPIAEVRYHAQHCADAGTTYVVTTRVLTDLEPECSEVAFYGDTTLRNRLLGRGVFVNYIPRLTPQWPQLLAQMSIYDDGRIPDGARGLIELRAIRVAAPDEQVDSLEGMIDSGGRSDGLPLTLQNIPRGASRAQVYYRRDGCGG